MRKAKGDYLDQVYLDQKVLEMIRQERLVLVIGAKSLKTRSRDQWFLSWPGVRLVRVRYTVKLKPSSQS